MTEEELLNEIGRIRAENMLLWNKLMNCVDKTMLIRMALEADHGTAKEILGHIADNDQKVVEAVRKLII